MNESIDSHTRSLPLELERQVDQLCDEFEEALKRGEAPNAELYLARIDEPAHRQLLHEMAKVARVYAPLPPGSARVVLCDAESGTNLSTSKPTPNVGDATKSHLYRSLEILQQIDEAGTRFEQALYRGEQPRVERFVQEVNADAQPQLVRELLTREMEFRARRGETPSLDEYKERLPDHLRLVKYLYFEHFIPTHIGDFSIQRLLGRGSFGLVYQGWDSKLSRNVAIKVFRRHPDDADVQGGYLLREARAAAQLRHPGVVAIYAVMPDADGDEFLVLEYVDGKSLEEVLRSERLAPDDAIGLLLCVTQALQHAHQNNLVHRDLKPANILMDQSRRPRVTDFGLALDMIAVRRMPDVAGTLAYMAPEQVNGETHRIDARTDLWAVGVLLYRMLAGKLPFSGEDRHELMNAIRYAEPEDLLPRDATIPAEIARIARKCLAKRMSERYQSAAELAEDLQAYLNRSHGQQRSDRLPADLPAPIVPKGLRCFDANDREFFLSLVPGPRDRGGVPEEVRFWENYLRSLDSSQTFRVGLLYGPSGCGKSSLVRAGILPRLPPNVKVVMIEATHEETEQGLVREIRRQFPKLPPDLEFPQIVGELREGMWLGPGEKLLVVIDQFEQWLHGWRHDRAAPLVEMLRQCDGGRVQALVLVRDDFWMPATRFFQQLDVPLVEGANAAAVDLFDHTHAEKVLAAFGAAYGRIEPDPARRPHDQQRFLERAVAELAVAGWIVPVRLCIFAEMVKSRPWTPHTLQEVGGAQGLGAAFLEEVFDSRSASPMHRLHRKAARQVLERLLPPRGTDIRGHLVPESELQVTSGYQGRPADFAGLLRCLDHELRLITPSEMEDLSSDSPPDQPAAAVPKLYQLTHDYLVTAIRGWLNQSRRRTLRGRAELRLAEYAEAYGARQEARQLPSWWEYLSLLAFTRPRRWRATERAMMGRATRHHALRYGLVLLAAIAAVFVIYDRMAAIHVEGLVQALTTSNSSDVLRVAGLLTEYRGRAKTLLTEELAIHPQDSREHVRLLLGLVAVGEPKPDQLFEQLMRAEPPMAMAIAEVLRKYGPPQGFEVRLWQTARDAQALPERRLRACVALAQLAPQEPANQWQEIAGSVAGMILRDSAGNPSHAYTWISGFAPARQWFVAPLRLAFADVELADTERLLAATMLAEYEADHPAQLVELALQATPKQFDVLDQHVAKHAARVRSEIAREAQRVVAEDLPEDDKDRHARRKANATLLMRFLGDEQYLWPALEHDPDPRLRSFLLDHLYQFPGSASEWVQRLKTEPKPGIRQALILVLGSTAGPPIPESERTELVDLLLRFYREDVDSGVHGAAQWTLSELGCRDELEQATADLAQKGMQEGFDWYVTKSGITMIIFDGPIEALLGSPETEPKRDASNETQWKCTIDWSFAISATEITQAQFLNVCPDYTEYLNEFAPTPQHPANAVVWEDANKFCRLLCERDGIQDSDMVVPPVDELRKPVYADFRTHTGYRLPIEAEWEVACRADTITSRFFGNTPDLLFRYCCYIANSGGQSWSVATGWPNSFGGFDFLGNVSEWCYNKYVPEPGSEINPLNLVRGYSLVHYPVRGNEYNSSARMIRAANRKGTRPDTPMYSRGFRIAHTVLKIAPVQ